MHLGQDKRCCGFILSAICQLKTPNHNSNLILCVRSKMRNSLNEGRQTEPCPTFPAWQLRKSCRWCKHEADRKDWLAKTQLNKHIRAETQENSHTSEQTHTHKLTFPPNPEERKWCQQVHRQQLVPKFWQICTKREEIAETGRRSNACWIFHNVFTGLSGVQDVLFACVPVHTKASRLTSSISFIVCVQYALVWGRIILLLGFTHILVERKN